MPSAVPALPDTERRTTHTISGVGPYAVSFDLYGDGTDYQNWIKVYDDGVELTVTTDWTLDSPSGSLSALSRPITDARVTLVSGSRSGTLTILGELRPRRTTQLTEGVGESARSKNQTYTQIIATMREFFHAFTRTVRVPPGETMALLAVSSSRASKYAKFNASGDLEPGLTEDEVEEGATAATAAVQAAEAPLMGYVAQAHSYMRRAQQAAALLHKHLALSAAHAADAALYFRRARTQATNAAASAASLTDDQIALKAQVFN